MIKFDNLQRVLAEFGNALTEQYKQNLTDSNRIASGKLITSVNTKVLVDNTLFEVTMDLEDYYIFIENGTRPHFPPINKILEWVKVKRMLPTPMANGKLPTEQQLAWMIAKKIDRVGTEGTPDLENAITDISTEYETIIEDALDKDILGCFEDLLLIFNG